MSDSLRYSVLGAGAMGSAFGARLRLAGFEVELLNRSPAHSEAIRNNGLKATLDGKTHHIVIKACTVAQAGSADVVILFTKTHQIDAALEALPATLRHAHIVTLQNGLGNGARVARHAGIDRTIEGVSMMPAGFVGPGEIASSDPAQTWLYAASGQQTDMAVQIGADFNAAGITTRVTPEVQTFIWQKACFNIAMNGLCGLTQGSPGLLEHCPDGKALAHELADEALHIARLHGVPVDSSKVHGLIDYACANHTYHKPSLLQDLEHERRTEIAALNGYLVALAEEIGERVPLNQMMFRLVKVREQAPDFWRAQ